MAIPKAIFSFIITVAVVGLFIAAYIFYLTAGAYGAQLWFGWSGWWVVILGVALTLILRNIGLMAIMIVGAYGAYFGWHWEWWWVGLVFFPGFALMLVSGLFSAIVGLASSLMKSRPV
ncbi:hypothetical protein [Rhizobium sp. A37_96]